MRGIAYLRVYGPYIKSLQNFKWISLCVGIALFSFLKISHSQEQWHKSVTLVLGRWRENDSEFKVILGYIVWV